MFIKNKHIKKIFDDSELEGDSVLRNFRITASDGKSHDAPHYNLQMIIAVGFKVNSERAVQFRKWVNNIAKEYTIKSFAMDDEQDRLYKSDYDLFLEELENKLEANKHGKEY